MIGREEAERASSMVQSGGYIITHRYGEGSVQQAGRHHNSQSHAGLSLKQSAPVIPAQAGI
jgi:hypothetical protein